MDVQGGACLPALPCFTYPLSAHVQAQVYKNMPGLFYNRMKVRCCLLGCYLALRCGTLGLIPRCHASPQRMPLVSRARCTCASVWAGCKAMH